MRLLHISSALLLTFQYPCPLKNSQLRIWTHMDVTGQQG